MMQLPVCPFCKNFSPKSEPGNVFCKAFPNGVPEEIWSGNYFHSRPFEGDNGIMFEDNEKLIELDGMKKI